MADQRGEYHGAETSLPSLKKPCLWRRYGLHRLYSRNVRHGKPPYWQVHLRTAGELLWILHVRDWRGAIIPQSDKVAKKAKWFTWQRSGDGSEAQRLRSADLQGINLKEVDLSCIVLDGTNLSNADLRRASLRSASVVDTELTGALINETNWQE
ncbi:MAG TPA: pentapeptide repeat-containing protein, partial [Ktedonobacterales bacterium]|nr:pentapeptide repeat-containing protein [Ktedonobacterales bacterium]